MNAKSLFKQFLSNYFKFVQLAKTCHKFNNILKSEKTWQTLIGLMFPDEIKKKPIDLTFKKFYWNLKSMVPLIIRGKLILEKCLHSDKNSWIIDVYNQLLNLSILKYRTADMMIQNIDPYSITKIMDQVIVPN